MAFKISAGQPPIRTAWMPVDTTNAATTLYVGQLVKWNLTGFTGVAPLAVASGVADVSGVQKITGVVIGTNDFPQFENFAATYGQYSGPTTAPQLVATQLAHKVLGAEGMHPKGDPMYMVEVALIGPETWLEGPLHTSTFGTAPSLLTVTAVNATMGLGFTTNALDFTPVAQMQTFYCRTGANAGIHRVSATTSTTVHTFATYWPYTIAVGDTFIAVPARQGDSYLQLNSGAGYIGMGFDITVGPVTNYFICTVADMDLREAGKEKVIFRFNASHFSALRA